MADHNVIFGGKDNKIENSTGCTIINGQDNTISNRTNTHILGDNITTTSNNSFYISCSNGVFCDGDIISNFNLSDSRLKNNKTKIKDCLSKVMRLDGISFTWNKKQSTYKGKDIGLIAQQVKEIAPEIVEERESGTLAIKYEKIIPLLIGAINEQQEKLNELENQLSELGIY